MKTTRRFGTASPRRVIHEFGHYFGMSEEEIEEIEEKYWRGESLDEV